MRVLVIGGRMWAGAAVLALVACESPRPSMPSSATSPVATESAAAKAALAAPASAASPSSPTPAPADPPRHDVGIYPDLTDQVQVGLAWRLAVGPREVVLFGAKHDARACVWVAGSAVAFAPASEAVTVRLPPGAARDADGDSIPDALDILIGAKRAVAAAAPYVETYRSLGYPGGDVPRDEGVCSDVIVRALRNAGYDLQALVHDDAVAAPKAYAGIAKLDPNIDHRRVRNLVTWFERHWLSLPTDPADTTVPWLPGDVVFLDTLSRPGPDHVGVVSDRENATGRPLVINSWTTGYRTSEMDLLAMVPVTHRFRVPAPKGAVQDDLSRVLERAHLDVGAEHRQVVLVTLPLWTATSGRLRTYTRDGSGAWHRDGDAIDVKVGDRGLSRDKAEGDHRSPAGVFELGTAFGRGDRAPAGAKWPYKRTDERDRWVDDPASPFYNTWQRAGQSAASGGRAGTGAAETRWRSAEALSMYDLGLVVRYNDAPVQKGRGSAIFLHASADPPRPTVGCTSLAKPELVRLLSWLRPESKPVLVQVADALTP